MSAGQAFNPRLVLGLIAAGILAFGAFLLLLAYGGGIGSGGRGGRADAQSVSATGFKGLVTLVGEFHDAYLIEGPEDLDLEDLIVVTLEERTRAEDVSRLLERRRGKATLIVLPKWLTVRDPARRGWVRARGPYAGGAAARLLGEVEIAVVETARALPRTVEGEDILDGLRLPVPQSPQLISGKGIAPLARLPGRGALVARLGDQPHYVVADPDLLNNHGLRDPAAALAALRLIEGLNATDAESVNFDLTLNGVGTTERPNILRTAFEPPFLVMTLALLAAALLAGLHGAFRFGPARREERAIAFGKAALVENSAGLIRLAGRESRLGGAYAEMVRQEAARATGAHQWLREGEIDSYLDRLGKTGGPGFSELAARLYLARDRHALVAAARALFQWKKEIIR